MIEMIEVGRIFPHPKNPRKDLGDLTELNESVKARGVLQNLTVVPRGEQGQCNGCKLMNLGTVICKGGYDKDRKKDDNGDLIPCGKWESAEKYTVVIGHRRLAAAKLAGLAEVPCAVVDMDERAQIETMMVENMQRSDLTVTEQADGFQMMLDLGGSMEEVSRKTGFSESTIRRRVKLLELDRKKLTESLLRGATLMDFAELEKIEDVGTRNKALAAAGTHNFKWEVDRAVNAEKWKKLKPGVTEQLEKFAKRAIKENRYGAGMEHVKRFWAQDASVKTPKDAQKAKYLFFDDGDSVTLYRKGAKKRSAEEEKVAKAERERKERCARLSEICKAAYARRAEFVRGCGSLKKNIGALHALVAAALLGGAYLETKKLAEDVGVVPQRTYAMDFSEIAEKFGEAPERCLLLIAWHKLDSEDGKYFNYNGAYEKNGGLEAVYACLNKLGYEVSDEERAMRDGTHALYGEDAGQEGRNGAQGNEK